MDFLDIPEEQIVFKTVHGSHLYGLANENSDIDFYIVVEDSYAVKANGFRRPARQVIVDGVDTLVIAKHYWMQQFFSGVPQAVEALMSEKFEINTISDFTKNFRVVGSEVYSQYISVIKSQGLSGFEFGSVKQRRHAVRLAYNLHSLMESGRFNPTLDEEQKRIVLKTADLPFEEFWNIVDHIAGVKVL